MKASTALELRNQPEGSAHKSAPDIAAVLARCRAESVALVVDGAELLDDRSLTLLRHAAGRATSAAPVIVVTGPPAQLAAGAARVWGGRAG